MLFRKRLFSVLALIALAWMVYGVSFNNSYNEKRSAEVGAEVAERPGFQAGQAVGGGVFLAFVFCTGLPTLLFSLFMRWRNAVGLTNERRHQEQVLEHQRILEMMRAK